MPIDYWESDTYLAIMDEGREKQAKEIILMLGDERFGSADEATKTKVNAVTDLKRLRRITGRLFEASSWNYLLETR
jgi:hypothetical protein